MFTNVPAGKELLLSTAGNQDGSGNITGWSFGISGANAMEFTTWSVSGGDYDTPAGNPLNLQANVWYHMAVTVSGKNLSFYLNGNDVGDVTLQANVGFTNPVTALTLGAVNAPNFPTVKEQFLGHLDEVAVYGQALSQYQLQQHYLAAQPQVPTAQIPVADFPTNYVSLTTTFTENASGQVLHYQWFKDGSPVGFDSSTYTTEALQPGDAGLYTCTVNNGAGGMTNPPGVMLTVLPIPTTAAEVGLTNDLVLHLPFDSDYKDISGHNNNGTAVGSPTVGIPAAGPAAVGNGALHYSSDTTPSYNYVMLGKPSDLQFGSSDFSIAFWIRQGYGDISTNLPYIGNAIGSIGNPGWCVGPALATGSPNGAPEWSLNDPNSHNVAAMGTPGSISDGNWHHIAVVFSRQFNGSLYVDGKFVASQADFAVANVDIATNSINIGQDPSGTFAVPGLAQADLDDLGVWRRALTQLEVSGMYLAGVDNTPGVPFAPPLATAATATTIGSLTAGSTTLSYSGGTGTRFILVGTNNVATPLANWTRIHTNTSSPGTFTIPAVGSGPGPVYYRVLSQ